MTRAPAVSRETEAGAAALLGNLASGYVAPRCLHAVAELGVADALSREPAELSELARAVGADPDALRRVLRLLAAHGVFELEGDHVRHTPGSRLLRQDHPRSMRDVVLMRGLPVNWSAYLDFAGVVRRGGPAGAPDERWRYYASHPEEAAVFNRAMTGRARELVSAVVESYDFTPHGVIGDIGGGRGHLLDAVLEAAPRARGILFDLPHVIHDAGAPRERLEYRGGSFFDDALPACDLYVLMEVIHDWPDAEAAAILAAVHRAAPPQARLLIVESIVPEGPGPDPIKGLDVHMMALFGGRQRTRAEYDALLRAAGFSLLRVIETPARISILESVLSGES